MQSWFSEQVDFIHVPGHLFISLGEVFRRFWNLFANLFLFLLLPSYLEIITVSEQRNFTRRFLAGPERRKEGRRWWLQWIRSDLGKSKAHTAAENFRLPTTSSELCLLHQNDARLLRSLKIPFILQCGSPGLPHPSPSVVTRDSVPKEGVFPTPERGLERLAQRGRGYTSQPWAGGSARLWPAWDMRSKGPGGGIWTVRDKMGASG